MSRLGDTSAKQLPPEPTPNQKKNAFLINLWSNEPPLVVEAHLLGEWVRGQQTWQKGKMKVNLVESELNVPADAVLVVDDDEMVRQLVKTMLEKQGAPVLTARSGLDSVETYRRHERNIRWVLVDMGVEGSSGRQTFEELSRIRPDVRVIVTSGRDREQTLAGFSGRKPFGFLRKPFRMDTLASTARFVTSVPNDLTPGVA